MATDTHPAQKRSEAILKTCVSIDLEVKPVTKEIFRFAAVCQENEAAYEYNEGSNFPLALAELDQFCSAFEYVLGHNFIEFDARHLSVADRSLGLLCKPVIDTLWLNPLAFPRNPYHRLVKHYKDGQLQGEHVSDPKLDAELVFTVLQDQFAALAVLDEAQPDLICAYHYLTSRKADHAGFEAVFQSVRGAPCPDAAEASAVIKALLHDKACLHRIEQAFKAADDKGWALAYALAWISVAEEGNSVMPPWVRHQFPEASQLVSNLRDTPCEDEKCNWCRLENNPKTLLKRWFGFDSFRLTGGRPLQEEIVTKAIAKTPVLGVLPTGTGKSVCYQIPALAQFKKTGALTVVISPLVALMADQVEGMRRQGIGACTTINGMLSLPERQAALDSVRLGSVAILLISPEQLRSPTVRSVLKQREIGYWVLDEAHCISKWGQDFRPDYRYVGRFIQEYSDKSAPAPVLCLTATAKPDVIEDITDHFKSRLGVDLTLFNGGVARDNLCFKIVPTDAHKKLGDILSIVRDVLPAGETSGAIIYCSTRAMTEYVAKFLECQGLAAGFYHAGLTPETKRDVQRKFSDGELRVIAATNAFGMGIDKPDIRLVVHADIPGSLENYLQEAGRAGRDQHPAKCILLFNREDVERQFNLSARSRLTRPEISAVLKSLRRLDRRLKSQGQVVATSGEILQQERGAEFERDAATNDTRVKTAVSWLEESVLLKRDENRTQVFPSSLRVKTLPEADEIFAEKNIKDTYRDKLTALVQGIMKAPPDQGITTDELCGISGLTPGRMRRALFDLESLGVASNDTAITIFVHLGVADSSAKRLQDASDLEQALIDILREHNADPDSGVAQLNLKLMSQALRDEGHATVRPDIVDGLVRGMARDGLDEDGGIASLRVRKLNRETLSVTMQRTGNAIAETAQLRRLAASILLTSLQNAAPAKRGKDIQVETTMGDLTSALLGNLDIVSKVSDPAKLLDRALLWLRERGIVTLGKGLTIFRPAMTIKLNPGDENYTDKHFKPLSQHYQEQTLQIHIMSKYAETGLESMEEANALSQDYFTEQRDVFTEKWLPHRPSELRRQTTPASWQLIVKDLGNRHQEKIAADDRDQTNVLVLAGPGSGKTRILVHRIAYLIRVRRERPESILTLVYNRHAAVEIRTRLRALIGDDARHVAIYTCHGLAMRLVGISLAGRLERAETIDFDDIMDQAINLLRGEDLSTDEADAQRETLIEGYRWLFVDEYQDIGQREYDFISAVAGRSIEDKDQRLSLFAVGDDDQNIYSFNGASVAFIRRFQEDYAAQPVYLIENYRSTTNIILAANHVISSAEERMKTDQDIRINHARRDDHKGGVLEKADSYGSGRVQVFQNAQDSETQAVLAVDELERLSNILPNWEWTRTAIISREWSYLQPVRSLCEARGIKVHMAGSDPPSFWRLRETQALLTWLRTRKEAKLYLKDISRWMQAQPEGYWWEILSKAVEAFGEELGDRQIEPAGFLDWLADWGRDMRQRPAGLCLLTAHRAKGLEFDHVIILDGGWDRRGEDEDKDAQRRLFYVAMTRARQSVSLMSFDDTHPLISAPADGPFLIRPRGQNKIDTSSCHAIYKTPDLSEIDLDFAGRFGQTNTPMTAIEQLELGDKLDLIFERDAWRLKNERGVTIGKLARKFEPPEGMTFREGRVYAILDRFRDDSSDDFKDAVKQERWSVVLPELIFKPDTSA